jgi:HEAT repeat protein
VPLLNDEYLRAPVIEALGELGDEDVTVPLVDLLNTSDAPPDVIASALAGLHDRYQDRHGAGEQIADLVRRRITAAGTQQILDALQRVTADRLPGLATVLGWLEGDAVQRALTRLLGHGSVRSQVVAALVRYGAGVVELLTEQLRAEDMETRQAAAVALGRIGDRRATLPLVAALDDRELAVPAAGALARIGDRAAFDALLARLGDPDPSIRQAVIAALNSIGHPDMPPRVADLLGDPDPLVRESAVRIAGYFGYPECLDRFLACCQDPVESVRRTAVEHAALFEDDRMFDALAHALASDVAAVRAAAASALARASHRSAGPMLTAALHDSDPWVRYAVVRSLGVTGDPAALRELVPMLREDPAPHVRLAAIDAIARLKPPDAVRVLEPLTASSNDDISRAAITALAHVDQPEALPLLERFLRAPEPWRRHAAIDAVMGVRDGRAPEVLEWAAATEEIPDLANAAVSGLATIASRAGAQAVQATRALVTLTAEPRLRGSAIAALGNLPPGRAGDVAEGLRHPSIEVRRAAVEALSRMKHPDASRELEAALDDAAAAVRLAAIAELKRLGTRASQRKLMTLARSDGESEVRAAALRALARSGDSTESQAGGEC